MKKTKKIICLIMSALMCILILSSCGGETQNQPQNPNSAEQPANDGASAEQVPDDAPESEKTEPVLQYMGYVFPDENYGGYEFRILNYEIQPWAYTVMSMEEQTGDAIDDAIYTRNAAVEESLNIKITEVLVPWGGMEAPLNKSVRAGTDDYDISMLHALAVGATAQRGSFVDLKNILSLELGEPWWDQNANKNLELAGRLFFTTTDATAFTFDMMGAMYFNKAMIGDLALENPYSLVRENKWTMDKMLEMMRAARRDADGDGVFTYEDIWGFSAHAVDDQYFFSGPKMDLVGKDNDGYPVLRVPDEQFAAVYAKIREIFNLSDGYCISPWYNEGNTPGKKDGIGSETFFVSGNALFMCQALSVSRMMRESDTDFGIIPFPKYNEAQENYYAVLNGNFPTFQILITQKDPEMAGVIINALTAASSTTLKPAYYDVALNYKLLRDEDSVEMVDLKLKNRAYNLALIYGWGGMADEFRKAAFSPTGENPVTVYEKYAEKTQTAIDKMINAFKELN